MTLSVVFIQIDKLSQRPLGNRVLPSCCEPHYKSEAKCKTFHMKTSFVCTNFRNKNFAVSLAFIMRFKAIRKWHILLVFFGKEHGTELSDLVQLSGPQSKFWRLQSTDPLRKATQNDFIAWFYTRRGTSSVPKEIFLSVFRQKYLFF